MKKWIFVPVVLSSALVFAGCNNGSGGAASGGTSGGVINQAAGAVATVNGTAIDREELHQFLEATGGAQALNQLIEYQLVLQEAKKQGVEVSDADVEATLQERRATNPAIGKQIDDMTKDNPARAAAFKRTIRYQLALDNILTKDIKVDDAALQKWFAANKDRYGTPARAKLGLLLTSSKPRADLMAQQIKAKTKTFAQLVEEQKKAKDPVAAGSAAEQPEALPLAGLPKNVQDIIAKTKAGETTSSLALVPARGAQPGMFGVLRVVEKEDAQNPSLEKVRKAVERDYKLEQLARQTVAKTSSSMSFDQAVKQAEQYVQQQKMQSGDPSAMGARPTRAETLQLINSQAVQELMARLRKEAKVESSDPSYKQIVDSFKPAPSLGAPSGAPSASSSAPAGNTASNAPKGAANSASAPAKP